MSPDRHALIKDIFAELVDCPAEERPGRLAERCGDDAELRAEVQRLLDHHQGETLRADGLVEAMLGDDAETRPMEAASSGNSSAPSFTAGTVVSERYRVVALLGEGGMGSVYRVQDLTLHQDVALKFMHPAMARDSAWLDRFHREARLARTITHPNVCRVFDIGEAEGMPFLSMEYVDGENLAMLLKRVGRVPGSRAVEIAFQLCTGLEAAHAHGVLHRDLKPANIMIDGRGQVRITDFGLAGLQDQIKGREVLSGTPAYMAPEQISGHAVTTRSDLYSLGLVLYELFTGHRAFKAGSASDYADQHLKSQPAPPSRFVSELDPQVERIILSCLEKDPTQRPESALAVAMALPGQDPLAAALAADRLPSPETVAAGHATTDRRFAPVTRLVACIALLTLVLAARAKVDMPWERGGKHPEALAEDARQLIAGLGYSTAGGADQSAVGFCDIDDLLALAPGYIQATAGPWEDGERIAHAAEELIFWYRYSPRPLQPRDVRNVAFGYGHVTPRDPPADIPGMIAVGLDLEGGLRLFAAVPGDASPRAADPPGTPPWDKLLEAAGLQDRALEAVPPAARTWVWADRTEAWEASLGERRVRIDALALEGRPLFFAVSDLERAAPGRSGLLSAWTAQFVGIDQNTRRERGDLVLTLLMISMMLVSIPWAWRHNRLGQADREGALHLAMVFFALRMVMWLLQIRYVANLDEIYYLALAVIEALAIATLAGLYYIALEPYARRHWPQALITWSRILRWRLRDAAVGEHVLTGVMVGLLFTLLGPLERTLVEVLGWPSRPTLVQDELLANLLGGRYAIAGLLSALYDGVVRGLAFVLLLAVLRAATGRSWLAGGITTLVVGAMAMTRAVHPVTGLVLLVLVGVAGVLWLTIRYGLVMLVTAMIVARILASFPLGFSAWYSELSLLALAAVLAITLYGFLAASKAHPRAGPEP